MGYLIPVWALAFVGLNQSLVPKIILMVCLGASWAYDSLAAF